VTTVLKSESNFKEILKDTVFPMYAYVPLVRIKRVDIWSKDKGSGRLTHKIEKKTWMSKEGLD
jgi:hypothetical protein